MSSQRTKKRFGSHRRVAIQNETPKTDEIQATGNSNVAQQHIPEEDIQSLCVQSNSENMPSPELRANRRKLGSRRKNKGQHERESAAELSDKPKEEVENSQVNETLETQLAVHSERQEEFCESHEHEISLYSAGTSAYCEVQNYTNCPEDIPENQHVEQDGDELDSKLTPSSSFVEPMLEGAKESDSIRSDLVQDNAPLIGSSERVLSSQPGVSCVTEIEEKKWSEDSDLLQQEGNLTSKESHEEMTTDKSNTTQHNKLECSTDDAATVSSSKDESSADEKPNERFSETQHSSVSTEEHDVSTTVSRRKLGSSRKKKSQQRVEDSVARPYHETEEEVVKNLSGDGDLETSNMSSLETAVQEQPADMMEEMDKPDTHQTETLSGEVKEITPTVGISDLYNPSLQPPPTLDQQLSNQPTVSTSSVTDAGSKESDENPDLFRHWGGSEAGNLVESAEKFNPGQDTEYEQSVKQTGDSSPQHEISTNKEDEQFCISEVGRAQDVDNAVKKMHNEDVKPEAAQEICFADDSPESVIHDGTEDSEICSINPTDLTEVSDSYQSELSVKSNGDCATKQGLFNLDEKQDEGLTRDNIVEALDQINEDSPVYDPRNTQSSDIERVEPAVEGWLEDDIKSIGEHEEEGLSEPMENKTPQTLQSETHSPLESQPCELGSVNVNEGEQNVSSSGAESEMSLMMETAVQEMYEEQGSTSELTRTSKHSSPPEDQQTTEQSNSEQIPQELPSVYSVSDTESNEGDDDNGNKLENETHFKSEDVESSVTPDITTEERNHEDPTEPECRVEQATVSSLKDEMSTKEEQSEQYSEALDTNDAVTKVQKEEVKETEMHQGDWCSDETSKCSQSLQSEIEPSLDLQPDDSSQNINKEIHTGFKPAGNRRKLGSSRRHKERQHVPDSFTESAIRDGTEESEIKVSDSYRSESSEKSKVTCANKQEVSNSEEKQDMFLKADTLDQIHKDFNVYDLQKTQTSGTEGLDPAEDDIKSTVEQSSELKEEGLLTELMEHKTLQTLQSETHSPLESQPHDYSVITDNSEELGSVHVNEGEQNVISSGAESEMSLMMETAVQEMSEETRLEGKDRFDPARTEGVSDQAKENAQASASELTRTSEHSSPPGDQQTTEQSNSEQIPQELPSVYSVTDTESNEGDDDNGNKLENETHFKSEDVESEQATVSSLKDEMSTKEEQSEQYSEALDTNDAVTKVQKEEVKETEMHQGDWCSDETSKYSQSLHTGNRRKLGSSRRHKERQHVPVTEAYAELKEEVVKAMQGDEVSEKEKMPPVTETTRQDALKDQIGLDLNPTEKMRKNRSTTKEKENAEQMLQEDTTLQPQNSVESSATVSTEGDNVKSTEQVSDVEKKLLTEPNDLSPPTGHETDLRESAEASDLEHCDNTDSNRSLTCDALYQKGAKQTIQDNNTEADRSVDLGRSEQEEVRETCGDTTLNKNVTCALVDTGHEENSRTKAAVNVSEESEISGTPAASNGQQVTPAKPPAHGHGNVQGTRRKMGSTRKSQLNRKEMYNTTKVNNLEVRSDERNNDSMKGVESSSLILTKDVSQRENKQSSLSNLSEEQQKMNENNSGHDEVLEQQSCTPDLQATECNVIQGTDYSTVLSPQQAVSHTDEAVPPVRCVQGADEKDNEEKEEASVEVTQGPGSTVTEAPAVALADMEKMKCVVSREAGEHLKNAHVSEREPSSVTEGAQNTNFDMMNANFSPANRRRKMGSTRRNLGSRSRDKDLYQKQEEDNEVTATVGAGDASTESVSGVIAKEPQLHDENTHSDSEQRKETVVQTVECSHARESHMKPPALENIEENPGSLSQPTGMEPHLTPKPRSSPKHEVTSESAAGGRRRKMGSHRKSHALQNAKDQIVGEDRLMDTQREGDITRLTDERDERREEPLGLDRLSEVNKHDEKPPSNISVSGAAEHSQMLSEKAPKSVTPVPRPDAGFHLNQEIQNKFSSGAASSHAGAKSRVFNVLLVGDSSVGKTSFLKRAHSGKFASDLPSSVGIDSCRWTVVVDGKPVVLQLWDTAGQERFRSITRQVFHRAQAFLLMYDITSSESFSAVRYWANCIQEGAADNVTILLLGNKSDCAERQIKPEEGETLSKEYNFDFMECSAATGENVIQTLEAVARILKQNADTREESMVLHKEPPHRKRSGCC